MTLVDPMRPIRRRPKPQPKPIVKTPEPAAVKDVREVKKLSRTRFHFRWHWLLIIGLVAALLVLPEFIGQLLLIVYAVVVFIKRSVVHLTFGLAVLLLALSPLLSFLTGSEGNGGVLASYSFFLLIIGFMQAIREYRRFVRDRPTPPSLKA